MRYMALDELPASLSSSPLRPMNPPLPSVPATDSPPDRILCRIGAAARCPGAVRAVTYRPTCADSRRLCHASSAAQIGGTLRVLPDTRLSPSVTLTIGVAGGSASVQRRLDWSA